MEQVSELLVFLAKNADPKRFFPFPAAYRHTQVSDVMAAYSTDEYAKLKSHLDNIKSLDDLSKYPTLAYYILSNSINMSYHGTNSVNSSITEYEFKYSALDERIRKHKYKSRWYLFHGSSLGNWHSILRTGIRNMSNTQYMTTGAAYGQGVYLSNNIQLSYSYGCKGSGTYSYVSVIEVFRDPEEFKKTSNIYVVNDASILLPRYLYQVSKIPKSMGEDILEYYKKITDASLARKKSMIHRIKKDITALQAITEIAVVDLDAEYIEFECGNSVRHRVHIDLYPIEPPLCLNLLTKQYSIMDDWVPSNNLIDCYLFVTK